MIAALLLLLQSAAPPPPARRAEIWEPWLSWGCQVREAGGKTYAVNGIIAQRNEPDLPVEYQRHERALRVIRDDSGAFAGLQARSPMFVERPDQYWAIFMGPSAGPSGIRRSLTLKVKEPGGPGTLELFGADDPSDRPYASGPCITRLDRPEAKP